MKAGVLLITLLFIVAQAYNQGFSPANWITFGRGHVEFKDTSVIIDDCSIHSGDTLAGAFQMTFSARSLDPHVQIWSGFGFYDRDNRYALGMRGGNSNDLYLCRYETLGKDEMLALESVDFGIVSEKDHVFKIVFIEGAIRVYLNDEEQPRIVVNDSNYVLKGFPVLGGGWVRSEFGAFSVRALSTAEKSRYHNDTVKYAATLTALEKEQLRKGQRAASRPEQIGLIGTGRMEIPLHGRWLFKPAYEVSDEGNLMLPAHADDDWHVMEVPQF